MSDFALLEEKYAAMVQTLAKSGMAIMHSMTSHKADIWHGATGVCTEAGELLDAAKKYVIYDKDLDIENVIEELGDVEFYLEVIRQAMYIDRETTLQHNMEKLARRYPGYNFSNASALHRADKIPTGSLPEGLDVIKAGDGCCNT